MSKTAFVVEAETGEYEDRAKWSLCVCMTAEIAEKYMERIQNWFALQGYTPDAANRYLDGHGSGRHELSKAFQQQFGKYIDIEYTGVQFSIVEIPVVES